MLQGSWISFAEDGVVGEEEGTKAQKSTYEHGTVRTAVGGTLTFVRDCLNKRRKKDMKTDIEIAQEAVMEPITKVAESIGIEAG